MKVIGEFTSMKECLKEYDKLISEGKNVYWGSVGKAQFEIRESETPLPKKIVSVSYDTTDKGLVGWLHRLPLENQWRDMRLVDLGKKYGFASKMEYVQYGQGFRIENESDPLFIEFKNKFPNTPYEIKD